MDAQVVRIRIWSGAALFVPSEKLLITLSGDEPPRLSVQRMERLPEGAEVVREVHALPPGLVNAARKHARDAAVLNSFRHVFVELLTD